jgi:hypothetical protein
MKQPMQRLSAAKILDIWEACRQQHELDRALTLLSAAMPGCSREELAELSIGERDAGLLQLRTLVLGSSATGFAECPQCSESIEFSIDTAALTQPKEFVTGFQQIEVNGTRIRFRLPTTRDLAAVITAPDAPHGVRWLIDRCVVQNSSPTGLPEETAEALSRAMLEADPQAEITLALICPNCAQRWEMLFDIVHFFWNEIAAEARRLLREVDALACLYGWTEREILNLPAARRQSYLELATA